MRDLSAVFAEKTTALLVAKRDCEILGCIHMALQAEDNHSGLLPRQYVKVSDMVVARKCQRNGAGAALMQAAERWAGELGIYTIELNIWEFNREVYAFYRWDT